MPPGRLSLLALATMLRCRRLVCALSWNSSRPADVERRNILGRRALLRRFLALIYRRATAQAGPHESPHTSPHAQMPETLVGFIIWVSGRHQIWIALCAVLLFVADTVPLEVQRRLVNSAVKGGDLYGVLMLAIVFAALTFLQGLIKIGLNLYRNWIGESAVRWLRNEISHVAQRPDSALPSGKAGGVEIAMVVAEVDPIGGFVGASLSDPILQIGILLSVFGYLIYLQPLMALVGILVFLPQCFLVPLMQGAINRRVGARIWVLRKISVMLVDTVERDEATSHSQSRRVDQVFRLNMSIFKLKFVLNFAMNWLNSLGTAIILGIGGYLVVQGRTEIGTVVAFVSGLAKINDPWSDLVNWYRDYRVIQARYRLVASAMRSVEAKEEEREPQGSGPPGFLSQPRD
ncbi:ABC transporter ATP-binding protein [Labrys sp. KNU-23]|uniref:ABC transporter transmembrane domain-containing protein n=1 Tax=Labrys sp. KNU-23 TaxID=2789216 RepID=UPI001FF01DE9|nr:ABC transporter ATP-binding protein [Labrys sp. KNU-23]